MPGTGRCSSSGLHEQLAIQALLAGDERALEMVFVEPYGYLKRYYNRFKFKYGINEPDAEELANDLMKLVFFRRAQFNPARGGFKSWLNGIAFNLALDYFRAKKRIAQGRDEFPEDLCDPRQSPLGLLIEEQQALRLLNLLPPDSEPHKLIRLSILEGRENEEIARILNIPRDSVAYKTHRARKALRSRYNKRVSTKGGEK